MQVEKKRQAAIDFPSITKNLKQEDSAMSMVVKVENAHTNQVAVKRDLFKLDFSKWDRLTNVGDDSYAEVTNDTTNEDKHRINPREQKSLLDNAISMLGLSNDEHNSLALGNCQILDIFLE